jgi:hypothetical protein
VAIGQVTELIGTDAVIGAAYGALGYGVLRLFEAEARRRASLDTR